MFLYQTPHAFKKSTKVWIDVDDEDDEDEILGGLKDVRKKRVKDLENNHIIIFIVD